MRLGVALGLLVLMAASAGANVLQGPGTIGSQEEDGIYRLEGRDVPIHFVVESFLLEAADFYSLDDAEAYQEFCERFGIESTWPSASHLGTLIGELLSEYYARHKQAASDSAREEIGAVWKPRALGKGFGELFEDLKTDGLDLSFELFLRNIEIQVRDGATRFSNEPFRHGPLQAATALFWQGAAASSRDVSRAIDEGGSR
jgi:hypothetical protein